MCGVVALAAFVKFGVVVMETTFGAKPAGAIGVGTLALLCSAVASLLFEGGQFLL